MARIFQGKKLWFGLGILCSVGGAVFFLAGREAETPSHSVAEPLAAFPDLGGIMDPEAALHPRLRGLADWQRPAGPFRVALQVGHWRAGEAPEELENLRFNTGASFGTLTEWEVGMEIAQAAKSRLEEKGIVVEILPTTIPPNYWADVFVSIHADGSLDPSLAGYKVAAPRRDHTGRAEGLAALLEEEYGRATRLDRDPNITRSMRGYYAFNWRRYDHSLHPMTVAAIVETGFLTNPGDRRIIVNAPERPAAGIASAIERFLGGHVAASAGGGEGEGEAALE
jgi:hypothetical protein